MDEQNDSRYGVTFGLRFSRANPRESAVLDYLAGMEKKERVRLMKSAIMGAVLEEDTSIVDPWEQKQIKSIKASMSGIQKDIHSLVSAIAKIASGRVVVGQEAELTRESVPQIAVNVARSTARPGLRMEDMDGT